MSGDIHIEGVASGTKDEKVRQYAAAIHAGLEIARTDPAIRLKMMLGQPVQATKLATFLEDPENRRVAEALLAKLRAEEPRPHTEFQITLLNDALEASQCQTIEAA